MAGPFASGKYAKGVCDICGFKVMLLELRETTVRGHLTGKLACSDCWDPDHPQNFLGMTPVYDPQALRRSRPERGEQVYLLLEDGGVLLTESGDRMVA